MSRKYLNKFIVLISLIGFCSISILAEEIVQPASVKYENKKSKVGKIKKEKKVQWDAEWKNKKECYKKYSKELRKTGKEIKDRRKQVHADYREKEKNNIKTSKLTDVQKAELKRERKSYIEQVKILDKEWNDMIAQLVGENKVCRDALSR